MHIKQSKQVIASTFMRTPIIPKTPNPDQDKDAKHLPALAGAWRDFPEPEDLRRACGQDVPREECEDQARWEHFSRTGEAVNAADADAWLARLEAGENVACPK